MKNSSVAQDFDQFLKSVEISLNSRKRVKNIEEIVTNKLDIFKKREEKKTFLQNFIDFLNGIEEQKLLPGESGTKTNLDLDLAEKNFDKEDQQIQMAVHTLLKNWPEVETEGEDMRLYLFKDTSIPDYEMTPKFLKKDWDRIKGSIKTSETMDRELIRVISDLLEEDVKETVEEFVKEIPEQLNRISRLLEKIEEEINDDVLDSGDVESLYAELQTYKDYREELIELIDHEPTREFLRRLGRNEAWIDIYWPDKIKDLQEIFSWLREKFPKVINRLQFFIGERSEEME